MGNDQPIANAVGARHAVPLQTTPQQANAQSHEQEKNRRSIRLKNYDYTRPGAYFLTVCIHDRACSLFGEIIDGQMHLNEAGEWVKQCWLDIARHFSHIRLDAFVVMPNHMHGIFWIVEDAEAVDKDGEACRTCATEKFGKPVAGSIPTVMRSFKAAVSKYINEERGATQPPVWQRNYYEHIIRDEESLNRIRQYIHDNPLNWAADKENPEASRGCNQ